MKCIHLNYYLWVTFRESTRKKKKQQQTRFEVEVFSMLQDRPNKEQAHNIIKEYVSDRLVLSLGYSKIYYSNNPFTFMDTIYMNQDQQKTKRHVILIKPDPAWRLLIILLKKPTFYTCKIDFSRENDETENWRPFKIPYHYFDHCCEYWYRCEFDISAVWSSWWGKKGHLSPTL